MHYAIEKGKKGAVPNVFFSAAASEKTGATKCAFKSKQLHQGRKQVLPNVFLSQNSCINRSSYM